MRSRRGGGLLPAGGDVALQVERLAMARRPDSGAVQRRLGISRSGSASVAVEDHANSGAADRAERGDRARDRCDLVGAGLLPAGPARRVKAAHSGRLVIFVAGVEQCGFIDVENHRQRLAPARHEARRLESRAGREHDARFRPVPGGLHGIFAKGTIGLDPGRGALTRSVQPLHGSRDRERVRSDRRRGPGRRLDRHGEAEQEDQAAFHATSRWRTVRNSIFLS